MTNHVHFIVEPGDDAGTVSELIKRLAGRQAAFVNKQERRNSALWEGRFKASPIQRANMVVEPGQYRWSSYRERIGCVDHGLLDMDANHHGLADNVYGRVELYQACLKQGASVHEMEFLRKSWARNQLTGNDHFIDEIEISLGRRVERRAGGRPAREKCGK